MKKSIIIFIFACVAINLWAPNNGLLVTPEYRPMPYEQYASIILYEQQQAKIRKENFERYKSIAYDYYYRGDYSNFLYYSELALKYGWYNNKMYYDRGKAYEYFHDYRKAKKEYRKAIRTDYQGAEYALEQCKIHQKEWKRRNKR